MTLGEFRKATEGLDGDLPLTCRFAYQSYEDNHEIDEEYIESLEQHVITTMDFIDERWQDVSITVVCMNSVI
jgi:hypothetical protein